MEEIIEQFKERPMTGADLLKLVDNEAKIVTNNDLAKYNTIEQALGKHNAMFILYEKTRGSGHWIVVFRYKDVIEYFDSYGYSIDYPLKKFGGKSYLTPLLQKWIDKGGKVVWNKVRLQKLNQETSSCGRWCAFRLNLRNLNIEEFQKLFQGGKMSPDDYVTLMTLFVD